MNLKTGIIGLPNVGKSTLFSAITNLNVEIANYPFATIDANTGVIALDDSRLEALAKISKSQKIIPATIKIVDIAGLVRGAADGEGLGNKFLANIRDVDAIIHLVRCFKNDNIIHVENTINPVNDIEIVNLELIFADEEMINKIISKLSKKMNQDKIISAKVKILKKIKKELEAGVMIKNLELSSEEKALIKEFNFLTNKPIIYVANVDDMNLHVAQESDVFKNFAKYLDKNKEEYLIINANLEKELSSLTNEEQKKFLQELKIEKNGLKVLTRKIFDLLNLGTFFTTGVKETKAWTFKKGTNAQKCAGIIHSDFARGFIRANVINYQDFVKYNGEEGAKMAGKVRTEGKEYLIKDGDICHFLFNT